MGEKRSISKAVGKQKPIYFEQLELPFENEGVREIKPLYPFVISGGKNTEHYYFRHISDNTRYKFNIFPEYFGMEASYTELFPERINKILKDNSDAKIFCVFDWDTIHGSKRKQEKHKAFINKYKSEIDSEVVVVCPSMPSIEYWFLLHFENHTQLIKTCGKTMQKLLTPYMMSYFKDTKGKQLLKVLKTEELVKDPTWVVKLCQNGKLEEAIQRAESNIKSAIAKGELDNQSYTYVYMLFK